MPSEILTESGRNKPLEDIKKSLQKKSTDLPVSFFLTLATVSAALSLGLALSQRKSHWANFVGQWTPTILLLGIYNKIIKSQSSDKNVFSKFLH